MLLLLYKNIYLLMFVSLFPNLLNHGDHIKYTYLIKISSKYFEVIYIKVQKLHSFIFDTLLKAFITTII